MNGERETILLDLRDEIIKAGMRLADGFEQDNVSNITLTLSIDRHDAIVSQTVLGGEGRSEGRSFRVVFVRDPDTGKTTGYCV